MESKITARSRCKTTLQCLSAVALFVAAVAPSGAQPLSPVRLPDNASGPAAIPALGSQLPVVANAYGLGAQKLSDLFLSQPGLGVDRGGALMFACVGVDAAHGAGAA